jgi:hypothetical protein
MRAEVAASLCSPEDRPIEAKVDPTNAGLSLSGKPVLTIAPLELELPVVSVAVPDFVLDLPTLNLTVGLEPTGVSSAIESLTSVRAFLKGLNLPIEDPNKLLSAIAAGDIGGVISGLFDVAQVDFEEVIDSLIFATAPALIAMAVAQPALAIKVAAKLDLGKIEVGLKGPVTINTGKFRLHGVPVQGNDQPLEASVDLDDASLDAVFEGLRATLKGCIVLNGGEPPPRTEPDEPPPVIERIEVDRDPDNSFVTLAIGGRGFGDSQGSGVVRLVTAHTSALATAYDAWSDGYIRARFAPSPAPGTYNVEVVSANNVVSMREPVNLV